MKLVTVAALPISILLVVAPIGCGGTNFSDADEAKKRDEANAADAGGVLDAGEDVIVINGAPPGCNVDALPKEDACVIGEGLGVFVSSSLGSVDGDGTRAKPFKTLQKAIDFAQGVKKRVYACAETYPEAITLASGVSLFGYFDCKQNWAIAQKQASVVAPSSPAMKGNALSAPVRIDSFSIASPNGAAPGASSIGVLVADGTAELRFVNATIASGRGVDGAPLGNDAPTLTNGPSIAGGQNNLQGKCGSANQNFCLLTYAPGNGGTNVCGSGFKGGDGGKGGYGMIVTTDGQATSAAPSQPGGGGTTETAAGGVVGVSPGADGVTPAASPDGPSSSGGTFTKDGFTAGDGVRGTDGKPGQGGGGGAGVDFPPASISGPGKYYGASGAGGGAGGCPGLATRAGGGGGASIALYVWNSIVALEATVIRASDAGNGAAGSPGRAPTPGGVRGPDVVASTATRAGRGSPGGMAGTSGNGAGGHSIGVAYKGAAPLFGTTQPTVGVAGQGRPASSPLIFEGTAQYQRHIGASADGVATPIHQIQ